jgi:hypothetical protein
MPYPRDLTESPAAGRSEINSIRRGMASHLIGCTVDMLADAQTITHGVVTGLLNDAGVDKLVVGGVPYDLSQLLTATPASFN